MSETKINPKMTVIKKKTQANGICLPWKNILKRLELITIMLKKGLKMLLSKL